MYLFGHFFLILRLILRPADSQVEAQETNIKDDRYEYPKGQQPCCKK